jgi:L-rhamnose isomerase
MLAEWRKKKAIDPDPLKAYRASGYEARVAKEREERRSTSGSRTSSSSFA